MKFLIALLLFLSHPALAQIAGVQAKSFVVLELDGTVILEKDSVTARPIASITKLLVAEQIAHLIASQNEVRIESKDLASRHGSLRIDRVLSEDELLKLALISSNNSAIYALSRTHNTASLIAMVNSVAAQRGLTSIHIDEPSGLNSNNRASALDIAKFVMLIRDSDIAKISVEKSVEVSNQTYRSTNPLIGKLGWNFIASKTGFINAAGGCIATIVEIGGRQVVVVILGSSNTLTRWLDLIQIRKYLSSDVFDGISNQKKEIRRKRNKS